MLERLVKTLDGAGLVREPLGAEVYRESGCAQCVRKAVLLTKGLYESLSSGE